MTRLKAPFPYHGGKGRHAEGVWKMFGDPTIYVEPFAGSLAVLLARDVPCKREIVCDKDANIVNFWRAIKADPEQVAYYADTPTFHHHLTAVHRWLMRTGPERAEMIRNDPDYYDAKAAGRWCWGISNWIGGGWCTPQEAEWGRMPTVAKQGTNVPDKRPSADHPRGVGTDGMPRTLNHHYGQGIQAQRDNVPDGRPLIGQGAGGATSAGVQAGRNVDGLPHIHDREGGQGVQQERRQLNADIIGNGDRLIPWFEALAQRMAKVIVLDRDWTSAVTPTLLMRTFTGSKPPTAVLLDPPYRLKGRSKNIYANEPGDDVAVDSYLWAVEHGDDLRIAYCCHEDDFEVPEGWTVSIHNITARKKTKRNEIIMYSPACQAWQEERDNEQMEMFEV